MSNKQSFKNLTKEEQKIYYKQSNKMLNELHYCLNEVVYFYHDKEILDTHAEQLYLFLQKQKNRKEE